MSAETPRTNRIGSCCFDGAHPEILLTDPPYCSGGFQESGRVSGSIGSKQSDGKGGFTTPTISSDNLSTRGYQVLMKNVLGATDIKVAYIFYGLENVDLSL